jgi:hypothetical protein
VRALEGSRGVGAGVKGAVQGVGHGVGRAAFELAQREDEGDQLSVPAMRLSEFVWLTRRMSVKGAGRSSMYLASSRLVPEAQSWRMEGGRAAKNLCAFLRNI